MRAWDVRHKKMVYDALQTMETQQLVTVNAEYFNSPFSFFDGCKWMLYCGVSDMEKNELCEADIVQSDAGAIYLIGYSNAKFTLLGNDYKEDSLIANQEMLHYDSARRLKRIGNIYDNPEMLIKSQSPAQPPALSS